MTKCGIDFLSVSLRLENKIVVALILVTIAACGAGFGEKEGDLLENMAAR